MTSHSEASADVRGVVLAYVEAGLGPHDGTHQAQQMLDALGLAGSEDPSRLSGGEARRAALHAAKTQQELQSSVIAQSEADIQAATAETERTGTDFGRYTQLAAKDAASVQKLDSARTDATKAAATLASSKARLTAERDRVHLLNAQEAGAEAALNQARAALKLAEIDLDNTVVRAAVSGVVGNWQVRIGRYVQPGMQLLAIVPLADAYVVANYKETQLDHMQVGQRVAMSVDSYPGRTVTGRIGSLSPASGAQFALLPPDNATGNFTKIVQRIPVKIWIDADSPLAGELRPGMSVIAKVDTHSIPDATRTSPRPSFDRSNTKVSGR